MNKAMAAHLDSLEYAPQMQFQFWSFHLTFYQLYNQLPWFEFETFLIIGSEFNELLLLSWMKLGRLLGYSTSNILMSVQINVYLWTCIFKCQVDMWYVLGGYCILYVSDWDTNFNWTGHLFLVVLIHLGHDYFFFFFWHVYLAWNENENELEFIPMEFIFNTHPSLFGYPIYNHSDSCMC